MGLPREQIKKREILKAANPEDMQTQEQPTHVVIGHMDGPPANSEVKPPVIVEEKKDDPPPLTKEEEWKITAEKWEQKFRSLQGTVESLEPTLRSEREKREQIEQELQRLRDAMPQPVKVLDPDEELTEEELKIYGDSQKVVEKIARKIAKGQLDSALKDVRQEIKELREANTRVQTDLTTTSETQFLDHVKRSVKGFTKIIESSEWKDYLEQKVPYSRSKISDALMRAHQERDLDSIKEIFEGFKPSKDALARMTSPTLNGGGAAPIDTSGKQKPILKFSDRKRMSEDKRMGRIKTPEQIAEWNKWDAAYREAETDGRIDYQH
jgi:vacuolar-type H+-ATPase subunit I/STV1